MAAFANLVERHVLNRVRSLDSRRKIGLGVILLLGFVNLIPIVAIAFASFTAHGIELTGPATLANYETLASQYHLLYNTLVFTIGSAVLTTVLGVCLAWIIGRTNAPFRRTFYLLIFFSFFLPPVIWEQSWIQLYGVRGVFPSLLGIRSFPIQTLGGMIVVQSIRLVAFGLIILIPLFASMDKSLEESSRMSGASTLWTAVKVTIPTVSPGIVMVFILSLIISLESFRVPLVLGMPEGINVLATAIYDAARVYPIDYGVAMAQAVALILLALPLLYGYRRYVSEAGQFQTVSGSGFQSTPVDLGRWRYVASGLVALFLLFAVILPTALMVYTSFLPTYISPLRVDPAMLSFDSYRSIFESTTTLLAFQNSIVAAGVGTVLTVVGSVGISWIVNKSDISYRKLIDYLAFLPISIPSVALGVGLIYLYLQVLPIPLYATLGIIILGFATRFLPSNIRIVDPAIIQIDDTLLESARLSGAGRLSRMYSIVIPIIAGTLSSVSAFRFALLMLELPLVMMLYTSDTIMVSALLWEMWGSGSTTNAAALGVVVSIFLGIVTLGILKAGQRIGGNVQGIKE